MADSKHTTKIKTAASARVDEREAMLKQAKWDALYRRYRYNKEIGRWQVRDRPTIVRQGKRLIEIEDEWEVAPWSRLAKRVWFTSRDYLLYDALQFGLAELTAQLKAVEYDLAWCRDKVCTGCTEEYVIKHGTVWHYTGKKLHEFHISPTGWTIRRMVQARWEYIFQVFSQRKLWLERHMLKVTDFPRKSFYQFTDKMQSTTIGTLVMAEAGFFPNSTGHGIITMKELQDKILYSRQRLARDQERLKANDLPELGGTQPAEQRATLERWIAESEQRIILTEWFISHYGDKLKEK